MNSANKPLRNSWKSLRQCPTIRLLTESSSSRKREQRGSRRLLSIKSPSTNLWISLSVALCRKGPVSVRARDAFQLVGLPQILEDAEFGFRCLEVFSFPVDSAQRVMRL